MRLILQVLLTAFAFTCILPHIGGIAFHGSFMTALIMALFFGVLMLVVDIVAVFISALLTISSFGLALLVLIPMWMLGFWLIPSVTLKVMSDVAPHYLTVAGWMPALLGGLVMMAIGVITNYSESMSKMSFRQQVQ